MGEARVLLAVALGGTVGSLGRYAATVAFPTEPGSFAWTVLLVNVTGCALLGVLTGLLASERARHPLARPFLGVGVLGGFTTFSTFALDTHALADAGALPGAFAYVGLTVVACLAAAMAGVWSVTHR
uniref:Fluoride-specific ion channel FluC n=1 Tax=uncultured Nocardioidaceae bacterium TaxID=253824 RepID=A0A6J4LQV4_9ACTN|nr:MAG: Fluoride ion transporter CrcB [uncultured Nocardioidaceae bacterium]